MSHATVLLITKEKPTREKIEELMLPYQETTDTENPYVIWEDVTDKKEKEYNEGSRSMLIDTEGGLHCPYSDEFYREPTPSEIKEIGFLSGTGSTKNFSYASKNWGDGKGYRTKVRFTPEGWKEEEVPFKEIYKEFKNYMLEWESYDESDFRGDRVGYYNNPNCKWDWYEVGGRWSGFFTPKNKLECEVGKRGLTNKDAEITGVDIIQKSNIDMDKMENEAIEEANKYWLLLEKNFPDLSKFPKKSWIHYVDDFRAKNKDKPFDRDEVSKLFESQEFYDKDKIEKLRSELQLFGCPIDFYCSGDKEAFFESQIYGKFGTFAILQENKGWVEKGKLGWFGTTSDENKDWSKIWLEIFQEVPEDSWLTLIDYHI